MLCKCDTVRQSTTTHVVNYRGSVIVIKNVPTVEVACNYLDEIGKVQIQK